MVLSCAVAPAATFTFENVPAGTATPFSDADGGIRADFSSLGGAFWVFNGPIFNTLFGNVLLSDQLPSQQLDIVFSTTFTQIGFRYAMNTMFDSDTISVAAYSGGLAGTPVGSASALGVPPTAFFGLPEGELWLSLPVGFDAVSITSTAPWGFAVDDVQTVPEPGSVGLVLVGFGVLLAFRGRQAA